MLGYLSARVALRSFDLFSFFLGGGKVRFQGHVYGFGAHHETCR